MIEQKKNPSALPLTPAEIDELVRRCADPTVTLPTDRVLATLVAQRDDLDELVPAARAMLDGLSQASCGQEHEALASALAKLETIVGDVPTKKAGHA